MQVAAALLLVAALLPPPARGSDAVPLLWRVEKGGRTSHLFGTVHVGLDLDARLQEPGRAALERAKLVFVEADLTSPETMMTVIQDTLARAELPPDRSLRALLRPHAWERLTSLHRGRIPPDSLDRMEPWFAVMSTLRVATPLSGKGDRPAPGRAPVLDAAIAARAKAQGTKVMPLESSLEGLEGFISIGRTEGVRMLEDILDDPKSPRTEFDGLLGAYSADDDRALAKAFGRMVRRRPALAEQILFRRNERWCERLVLWLGDGDVFVAAGVFHMLGERGLVELLRRRGYSVERVRIAAD